jgi:hypothetical protein
MVGWKYYKLAAEKRARYRRRMGRKRVMEEGGERRAGDVGMQKKAECQIRRRCGKRASHGDSPAKDIGARRK